MLDQNTANRPVDPRHVKLLADEMRSGRWKENGETIKCGCGKLVDGQHRLLAVIESGVTIVVWLIENLSADVFDTIDIGKRRSAADTLAVRGEKQCKSLAAALTLLDQYATGRMDRYVRYTNSEVMDLVDKYPEMRESVRICRETNGLIPPRVLTACHYLFARKNQSDADSFIEQLISGAAMVKGSSVYVLRSYLMTNSMRKAKVPGNYIMALLIKAWNRRKDGNVSFIRYRTQGDSPESFPVVAD